jgi:protein-S-isoprenylcysteine O-methyltransferase Ste14
MQPKINPSELLGYLFIFVAAPALTFIAGSWMDRVFWLPVFPVFPLNLFAGFSVMVLGLSLGIRSTRQLYQTGGGLPWGEAAHEVETSRLVVDGVYAYSRNPMVLGYSLLPLGMGLMFQSIGMMLSLTPILLLVNYIIVKKREEPRLTMRFGDEYKQYRARTPFIFPDWAKLTRGYLIPYIRHHRDQLNYVLLSETSLLVTTLLVFQSPPEFIFPAQKNIFTLAFAIICVLGIIAGVAPKWCSFGTRSERRGVDGVAGHHPDCGRFPGHTVVLGERVICAGCTGLVMGALFSLMGLASGIYLFDPVVGFWFGTMLVGVGLAQHFIDLGSRWVHLSLNTLFVIGAWFMFEAIQLMSVSFWVSIYFLAVTVFWIFTRIRASQWTHVGVCRGCDEDCTLRFQ